MKRRWLSVVGGFFVLTAVGLGLALGRVDALSTTDGVTAGVLGLVGLLFVLAGEGRAALGIDWFQFGGVGHVLLGCWLAFQAGTLVPADPTAIEWLMAGSFAIGGLAFVFIGIDWIRGGYHFDIAGLESGPLTSQHEDDPVAAGE